MKSQGGEIEMKNNLWNALVHPEEVDKIQVMDAVEDGQIKDWRRRNRFNYFVYISSFIVFQILLYVFREIPVETSKWLILILFPSAIFCVGDAAYECYCGLPGKSDVGIRNLIGIIFSYCIGILVFWMLLYTLEIFGGPNGKRLSFLAATAAGTVAALFVYADLAIIYRQYVKKNLPGVTSKQIMATKVVSGICAGVLIAAFLGLILYPFLTI